jgi:PhnB protein
MAQLSPYVMYNGNCEEAFIFYKSVFGGEFSILMRNKDIPPGVPAPPDPNPDHIMHISLPISTETVLMGSDMPGAYGPATRGNSFSISVKTASEEETTKIFNGLAEGGKITMPLEKTFWGSFFGMCIDKYDVQWMLSYDNPGS